MTFRKNAKRSRSRDSILSSLPAQFYEAEVYAVDGTMTGLREYMGDLSEHLRQELGSDLHWARHVCLYGGCVVVLIATATKQSSPAIISIDGTQTDNPTKSTKGKEGEAESADCPRFEGSFATTQHVRRQN